MKNEISNVSDSFGSIAPHLQWRERSAAVAAVSYTINHIVYDCNSLVSDNTGSNRY